MKLLALHTRGCLLEARGRSSSDVSSLLSFKSKPIFTHSGLVSSFYDLLDFDQACPTDYNFFNCCLTSNSLSYYCITLIFSILYTYLYKVPPAVKTNQRHPQCGSSQEDERT